MLNVAPRYPADPAWADADITSAVVVASLELREILAVLAASPDTWVSREQLTEETELSVGKIRTHLALLTRWMRDRPEMPKEWFFDCTRRKGDGPYQYRLSAVRAEVVRRALSMPRTPRADRPRTTTR